MNEWSLILFTILVQCAAGMLIVSEIARALSADDRATSLLSWHTPAACLLTAVGLVISLSHLGTPLHSVFTVANIGKSWLSREILATGSFFGLVAVLTLLRSKGVRAGALGALACVAGLVAVYVMSRVYQLVTIPVWDTGATALSFFGTTFLIGAVGSALLLALRMRRSGADDDALRGRLFGVVAVVAALGLALQFIGIPLSMVAGSAENHYGVSGLSVLFASGSGLFVVRMLLIVAGAVLFGWATFRAMLERASGTMITATFCALAFVAAGEVLGRMMFYLSYARIGL
ncbi:dimethyl sulfoxide reductase anchor subunit [Desulfobaculum senezii]|jgi:anaerobic dimethyl sulfoxide reductase subunit C (anchor subunit)|uniref:dimethyl sulfoxide reductase anchor subunit family protein n=1 Tax=Desulfobaculum sp. SPO524 TaxID=3378071 RepID=UPI0038529AF8